MNINTISRINMVQAEGNVEAMDAARDGTEQAIRDQKEHIDEAYSQTLKEANEEFKKAQKENAGSFWGTIFGGPLIGTLIGKAIGNAAGDGNGDRAIEAKRAAGVADVKLSLAEDRLDDAQDKMSNARERSDQVEKMSQELREAGWHGTI